MRSKFKFLLLVAALLVVAMGNARMACAAPPTADCSLLTPSMLQKVLGEPFGAPSETKAPPAYAKQSWGRDCEYRAQKGGRVQAVTFIVYEDASPAEAKQTFHKLQAWYSLTSSRTSGQALPTSKTAVGDEAYLDAKGDAIHVLKGRVRFYVSLDRGNEKQVTDLAAAIAARM